MRRLSDGSLAPAAAASFKIDASQTIYTFHLRPQKWSNGEAVTSYHFAKAWKYALDPLSPCIRADLFYPIKNGAKAKKGELPLSEVRISTPDEKTLVVELEHPTPYFLDLTATSFFCPLYDASPIEPTIFNGPFILGEHVLEQKLVFQKNLSYWDISSVDLDEVCFTMIKDPTTALALYKKGDLDLIGDPFSALPLDSIPSFLASGELRTKLISRIFYLLLNTNNAPLHNKNLRNALSLSIDRHQLTSHLFIGETPTFSHLPKTLSVLSEKELAESDKNAVSLFEKALSELELTRDTFPTIKLNYANLSGQKSFAQFLQETWRNKLGIKIEIECMDWNIHTSNLRKKNYQIGTLHLTTLYQDPMFYFDLFRDKTSLSNYSGWENESFRLLLERSEVTTDINRRQLLLKEAEKLLLEEMPVIPIFTQTLQYLVRKEVALVISDLGIYDFKKTKILE